ncbi:MAG TPA: class I SAM-dependent methyltransferase [Anaerolineales bacterium]|nr:class I SAM-dependent methyltransferase [Anaerolineales bacterium]
MRPNQSSLTAMSTAAVRALEMELPARERICNDPFAREFLPTWFYVFMKRITATRYAQRHASGDLGFIVARCRYMDDLLSEELDHGIQQLVILGAGFDSRAYRFGSLKDGVKVFEVDHPATQKNKLKKLKGIFGPHGLPAYLTFVPVDFSRDNLAACLTEGGYSEQLKALFIWEGVTPYLDARSVDGTLSFIANHSVPGSTIVFDYMCEQALAPKRDIVILTVSFLRRFFDEERNFQIEAGQIEPFLWKRGFSQVRHVTGADLQARYFIGSDFTETPKTFRKFSQ